MNFSITPIVRNLIIINVAIFAISNLLRSLEAFCGLHFLLSSDFYVFQFATYMFFHADFSHLLFNMFPLFMFGTVIERFWGSQRFFIFYILTGLGAGVLYAAVTYFQMSQLSNEITNFIANPSPTGFSNFLHDHAKMIYSANLQFMESYKDNAQNQGMITECISVMKQVYTQKSSALMVGASGAVMGVLMAFGLLFPNSELYIFPLPMAIKAKYYVLFYGLIEIYAGVRTVQGDNVAHFAHLGGMVMAFILIKIWKQKGNNMPY